jgi:hypothetical protein
VTGIYYVEMVDVLRNAGCVVQENSITNGWQSRARSSGGFPSPPLGVWWHHTASNTSPQNDLSWQIDGCDDAPVGNWLLDRDGVWWPVAAGASNCAGKGGPHTFSRGTVPLDSGNTRGWQVEVANAGTGQAWPQVQVDSYFRGSNALNALVGNQPSDVITHNVWAPTRKIDPATAAAVEGPWVPRSSTSSGTWNLDDIKAECSARAGTGPPPGPTPNPEDDDMIDGIYRSNGPAEYVWYSGGNKFWITDDGMRQGALALLTVFGRSTDVHEVGPGQFAAMGVVVGQRPPGVDDWGNVP